MSRLLVHVDPYASLAALAQDDGGDAVRDRILIALIAVVIDAAGLFA